MQRGEIRQKVVVDNSPSFNISHVRKNRVERTLFFNRKIALEILSVKTQSNAVTKCRLRVRRKTFATVLLLSAVCNLIKDFEKKISQGSSFKRRVVLKLVACTKAMVLAGT